MSYIETCDQLERDLTEIREVLESYIGVDVPTRAKSLGRALGLTTAALVDLRYLRRKFVTIAEEEREGCLEGSLERGGDRPGASHGRPGHSCEHKELEWGDPSENPYGLLFGRQSTWHVRCADCGEMVRVRVGLPDHLPGRAP